MWKIRTESELFQALAQMPDLRQTFLKLRDSNPTTYWTLYEAYLRSRARVDRCAFHEYCFRDPNGRIWLMPAHHREWNHILDLRPPRLLIEAPRDHAKTSQAIGNILWELANNPNLRTKIISASSRHSLKVVGNLSENILRNEYLHEVFPELKPDPNRSWNLHELFLERSGIGITDASIEAFGITSIGTGSRADLILFDDVVDFNNSVLQPVRRKQVNRAFREVWMNLLEPGALAWVLGTRYHEEDLYGELEELCRTHEAGWFLWKKPCVISKKEHREDGSLVTRKVPLWPEKFSMEALETKRQEVGDKVFARQWLLKTVSDDETVFLQPVWRSGVSLSEIPKEWPRFMGVDLARSLTRNRGAYTVFFTAALSPDGHRYPLEIVRGKFSFNHIIELFGELYEKHQHYNIVVENNACQDWVKQHVGERWPVMPVTGFTTGVQKAHNEIGIPSLAIEFSKGLWIVNRPKPALSEESSWSAWSQELDAYPNGRNTDTVMANWFCREAIRKLEGRSRMRIRLLGDAIPTQDFAVV